ncbi:MAG TPA: acyltransferase [Cellulomonadaceae bacterium]|nr:acyltransferase [Cellulomonadaceae bacterium]
MIGAVESVAEKPATTPPPSGAPAAALWRWSGPQIDPRRNSLNLLRLVLASLVLVAHAYYIAGVGVGPHIDGENLGGWAVYGFFAVSGYLITASRWSNPLGVYLVHRIARIFPAFLVCLVVMAVVVAPIGYLHVHGSLGGYLTAGPTTPANFVFSNSLLRMNSYEIAGTPANVPYPGAWNGSLWSLYYEFLCYLVVGALAVVTWVRRSPWWIALAWLLSVGAFRGWGRIVAPLTGSNADLALLVKLLPLFLGGALVQLLRERLPLHWTGAAASALVVVAAVWGLNGWGAQLTAPFIAYLVVYAGSVVPCPRLIRRHDISYGMYIYAFPVQQLLILTGIQHQGLAVYDVVALACTIPLATASWLLVERPVMRRARRTQAVAPVRIATA